MTLFFILIWLLFGFGAAYLAWNHYVPTIICFLSILFGPISCVVICIVWFVFFCAEMDHKRGIE